MTNHKRLTSLQRVTELELPLLFGEKVVLRWTDTPGRVAGTC